MRSVVIGGGISGLAGARALAEAGHHVTVPFEASDRLGGKIRTSDFAGRPVDEGPDAFLARVPYAVSLCRRLGLGDGLVSPATGQASLWLGSRLRPIPAGLVLGVPVEFGPLARSRILSPAGLARAAMEPWLRGSPVVDDVAVGDLVRRRYGREVHERLVDPLLGGINAGRTEELSLDVGAAQLAAVARASTSLTRGLRAHRREHPPDPSAPVFYAPKSGMSALVDALAKELADAGAVLLVDTEVGAIDRRGHGYTVRSRSGTEFEADRVLLAVPSFVAAPLLALSPAAAALAERIRYASVALVTLAYPRHALRRPIAGSGFLVPRGQRRLLTACSVFSNKWPHVAHPDALVVRASVGREGEERGMAMDDGGLVAGVDAEVRDALGLAAPPDETRVSRWPRSFPQFPAGHLGTVAQIEAALRKDAPGVAVAGAYLRGVGIPACIGGAEAAASRLAP